MLSISREYHFSAAHRLEGHPKCGRTHGHNYRVVVTLFGNVGNNGMLMDYGDLDKMVKPYIDDNFDHKYLVSRDNERSHDPIAQAGEPYGWNYYLNAEASTAEEIARIIHDHVHTRLRDSVDIVKVRVEETPKSSAEYSG